jgi:hypothetical protein
MAKNKTTETKHDVTAFIDAFADSEQKKLDSYELVDIMHKATGFEPKMWGPSIIGFGTYHYKYESGHEGDAPLVAFSPRKAAISLYIFSGLEEHKPLIENLGKFKMGKSCIYVKKLNDINQVELIKVIKATTKWLKEKYK